MPETRLDSVWLRPTRERTGQPSLSREQIVRAAIELLDAEGAAGLSMRRLGTKLGSGATSLYWHVANKDELLELAVDEVLGEIYIPEPRDTSWRIGASVYANGARATMLRHPWMLGLLGTWPTLGPNAMRIGERMVALFDAGGFTGIELSHAVAMLNAHAIGSATTESAMNAMMKRTGATVHQLIEAVEPLLVEMAPEQPHYDKWRRENGIAGEDPARAMDDGFAFGLERILDGLELWLTAQKAA